MNADAGGDRLRFVDALDLEPIVYKLMHPEPGETGLSLTQADRDVALYRCFLKLCVLYPDATIVPTRRLDHVWHTHMLDTAKYQADCEQVLGRFMHHFPYAGLRGEADRQAWLEDFAQTRRLFREHFGVDIGAEPAASACASHGDGSDCCVGCVKLSAADIRPRPGRCGGRLNRRDVTWAAMTTCTILLSWRPATLFVLLLVTDSPNTMWSAAIFFYER